MLLLHANFCFARTSLDISSRAKCLSAVCALDYLGHCGFGNSNPHRLRQDLRSLWDDKASHDELRVAALHGYALLLLWYEEQRLPNAQSKLSVFWYGHATMKGLGQDVSILINVMHTKVVPFPL